MPGPALSDSVREFPGLTQRTETRTGESNLSTDTVHDCPGRVTSISRSTTAI